MQSELKILARASREVVLPLALTMEEAAAELGMSRQRLDWLASQFKVRSVVAKGRRYVTRRELERVRPTLSQN